MSETERLLKEARVDVAYVLEVMKNSVEPRPIEKQQNLLARIDAHLAKRDVVEVTVLGYDPFDEREGVRFSSKDWKKLARLPKGTVLRAAQEGK